MTDPQPAERDEALERARYERDAALAALEAEQRHSYRRLERLEAQHERASEQASDRARAIVQLRAELQRLQQQPLVRFGQAVRKGVRALAAPFRSGRRPASRVAADGRAGSPPADRASDGPTTIAIHIAAPNTEVGATWGDMSFAEALRAGFEDRGWVATVHAQDTWEAPTSVHADVALHLFGVAVPAVRPGQVSLLWVISHPDRLSARRCRTYDAVFVASDSFRDQLAARIATPVYALHQATDPDRFFPEPSGPHHELLFVGSSRRIHRPILDALSGTAHDLAVYGGNWTPELLDPRYLHGEWIPNEDLHRYYSSADIVLNDHWRDMREEGFISNRVYDALASGAFVLSDRVPGMDEAFDGGVATYERDEDLAAIIEDALAHPNERRARAERGRAAVLARHTFAHRVDSIISAVDPLWRTSPASSRGMAHTPGQWTG